MKKSYHIKVGRGWERVVAVLNAGVNTWHNKTDVASAAKVSEAYAGMLLNEASSTSAGAETKYIHKDGMPRGRGEKHYRFAHALQRKDVASAIDVTDEQKEKFNKKHAEGKWAPRMTHEERVKLKGTMELRQTAVSGLSATRRAEQASRGRDAQLLKQIRALRAEVSEMHAILKQVFRVKRGRRKS